MSRITGMDAVTIPVADVQRAVTWYQKLLNARPSDYATETLCPLEFSSYCGPVITIVKAGGAERLRFVDENGRFMAAFSLACKHVRQMHERMLELGITIHEFHQDEDEDDKCSFLFEDPDGNVLALTNMVWNERLTE
ncbi:MAG TPA: VOC family protein [Candidatus Baltobacteraceae bacterium]|nr:VOC family protein [Candidatus Baltobacteraceae bacterium]